MPKAKTWEIETSITLDYRRFDWGLDRIVLDTLSNHLPADSNGSSTLVKLKQDGEYAGLKDANPSKHTEEVVFEDDGAGYDAGLLSVLFSTKTFDFSSVGQFGEGMKLAAAAALRAGVDIEYKSRNWSAVPFKKAETIGGSRIERLCFRITENGEYVRGSRTTFNSPSDELLEEIFAIPAKVLFFNDDYEELHNEKDNAAPMLNIPGFSSLKTNKYNSRIIRLSHGANYVFVKGIRIQEIDSLFSYDLGTGSIAPNRNFVNIEAVEDKVKSLLQNCTNAEVIERILRKAEEAPNKWYLEFRALDSNRRNMNPFDNSRGRENIFDNLDNFYIEDIKKSGVWADTFKRLYGENAVLASYDTNINNDARLMGFNPVRFNMGIASHLIHVRVQGAHQVTREREYKWVGIEELSQEEKAVLEKIPEINHAVLGHDMPLDVRIYSGLYAKSGREIEGGLGVNIKEEGGTEYVGIKRSQLTNLADFTDTYLHELGHVVTGAEDSDRRFTDFFVNALAKIAVHQMNNKQQ